jgi:hypothetical protein
VKYLIEAANSAGYQNARVLNMHTVSHNAEFYANGRLVRDEFGKLRRFEGTGQVADEIRKDAKTVLVFIPLEHLPQLTENESFETKVLGDNKELAIAAVSLK